MTTTAAAPAQPRPVLTERSQRGGIGDKPHIYPLGDDWACRCWIDRGFGSTPFYAYMDMVHRANEREWNRRCFG